jgi:hypothetical protein
VDLDHVSSMRNACEYHSVRGKIVTAAFATHSMRVLKYKPVQKELTDVV